MVTGQLVGRLCGLGALLLVTETAEAQPAALRARADTALIAAIRPGREAPRPGGSRFLASACAPRGLRSE
jgi:hypothetical protein